MAWLELWDHLHVPSLSCDSPAQRRLSCRWAEQRCCKTCLAWLVQANPEKNANKSWFPGSTQGRICCLMAEKEGNSNKDIVKRNIWSLAMCFICSTYNLYFTKRIKKYLKGQCPNRRLSCIGKYARNAISYKVSMDELRLFYYS